MFCYICQKSFKIKKTLDFHLKSKLHKIEYQKYLENPSKFKNKLGAIFINHFSLFISNIDSYSDISIVYQNYSNLNKYKIKGTNYKNLTEAINDLKDKIDIQIKNGIIYVKKLDENFKENDIDLTEIDFYFKI